MLDSDDPDQADATTHKRWQSIEVRHLVALAAVAREGSFRRAADELGYVQSAISGQIAHLEQAAGMRLLERASGTPIVELTDAGELLLRHINEILGRFESAYADLSSLDNRTASVVRIAGLGHIAPRQFARIMSLFRRRHPFARLVIEDSPDASFEASDVRNGVIDLLVSGPSPVKESLRQIALKDDQYVLLVSAGSELADRSRALRAVEIAALRPIVPNSSAISDELVSELARLGIDRHPLLAPESVATAQALVASGLGAALLPSQLIDAGDRRTVSVDVSHLLPARTVVLTLNPDRGHSPAVAGFARAVREIWDDEATDGAATPPETADARAPRPRAA